MVDQPKGLCGVCGKIVRLLPSGYMKPHNSKKLRCMGSKVQPRCEIVVLNTTDPVYGEVLGPKPLRCHNRSSCAGEACPIHSPSDHHMSDWPMGWRADRMIMERVCEHGVGHPDPDDVSYRVRRGVAGSGMHGCDGCC